MMRRILGAVMILFALTSCKSEEEEIKSNLSDLIKFSVKELSIEFTKTDQSWTAKGESTDDITALTAVFEVSPKATVAVGNTSQSSGVSINDFTSPVTYSVRAEDGTKTNFVVTITKGAAILTYKIMELPNTVFTISSDSIVATVTNGTDLSSLTAQFTTTQDATILINGAVQVSESTKNSFVAPIQAKLSETDGEQTSIVIAIKEAPNKLPIAVAGTDKIYFLAAGASLSAVTLDGSLSTDFENEHPTSYTWKEGEATLATGASATVELAAGNHTISLVVADAKGATANDEVIISVKTPEVLTPVDANADALTTALYNNLWKVANGDKFIFGQEFPLSFKLNGIRSDLSTSDCKLVSGDHPGVYGADPHYMLYKDPTERQIHIDEAKLAYQNGAVVTMEFHQQSKKDHKIYYADITSAEDKSLMYDIVNNLNGSRDWFYSEMDEVISIVNNDLGFPVVYRPWHEMDGNWFWWGTKATNHSPELYKQFYQLTVNYIKEHSNLFLFAWSPNDRPNADYYPGDTYVDIVGFDMYNADATKMKQALIELSDFASSHNKVAALTEVGYTNDFIKNAPKYWADVVLKAIKEGGSQVRIAWALAWFNAPWETSQSKLFIPDANSPQPAKDSFKLFKDDEETLFQEDVKLLNMYQ